MTGTRNMTLRNLADYYDPQLPDSALAAVPNGLLRELSTRDVIHIDQDELYSQAMKFINQWNGPRDLAMMLEQFAEATILNHVPEFAATPPVRGDRDAFYTILTKFIPQEVIDEAWQELKEAGHVHDQ